MRRSLVGVTLAIALASCGDFPEDLLQGDAAPPHDQQAGEAQTTDLHADVGGRDLDGSDLGVLDLGVLDLGVLDLGPPDLGPPDLGPPGQPCTDPATCASGFCVDGVCCNNACGQQCEHCNLPASPGLCTPVPAGQDPGNDCNDLGPMSCSTDGECNGLGACRLYAKGTDCGSKCGSGDTIQLKTCDGSGFCQTSTTDCFPYQCHGSSSSPDACYTDCSSSNEGTHCAGNMECSSSKCRLTCNGDNDCQGYWGCNGNTNRCYTYCNSNYECSSGGKCSNKHDCIKN